MIRLFRCSYVLLWFAFAVCSASAQVTTGTPPLGSFGGGPDTIDLANLNVSWTVPVIHRAGRGMPFEFDLNFNTSAWYPVTSGSSTSWQPSASFGHPTAATPFGFVTHTSTQTDCNGNTRIPLTINSHWVYVDQGGTPHPLLTNTATWSNTSTPCSTTSATSTVTDDSGYTLSVTGSAATKVTMPDGSVLNFTGGTAMTLIDRNGNEITADTAGHFYDTLSSTVPILTVAGTGTPTSPITYTYAAPGTSAAYTVKYAAYSVQTAFGCSGIVEYGPTSNNLVSEIDLPDVAVNPSDKYTFTYETTPGVSGKVTGRIASVTFPTGGTITYGYTGGSTGHITCADGSTSGLARGTPDGSWTYARTADTGTAYTTSVTDPQGNNTQIQFQGLYETQRQVYQGTSTILQTTNTCYNAAASPCTTTAVSVPISQVDVYSQLGGTSSLTAKHTSKYNTFGLLTEQDDYDYGSGVGPLLKKTSVTYASLGNNIVAFPQQVTVTNGAGNLLTQQSYAYDEGTLGTTSGTPQQTSITGARGNATTTNSYVTGTTFLTSHATYFDTGKVQTATDVNGAQTTTTYGACGNSFPTGVSEPLSLSKSMTWNCAGGVMTQISDENGKSTLVSYTDPDFWRPASTTDPTTAATSFTYSGPTSMEKSLSVNSGSSAVDVLGTLDGLGRKLVTQNRQGPGATNFDTVSSSYNTAGELATISMPCIAGKSALCPASPSSTTTYDALRRPLSVTDAGMGSITYSYNQNDVVVTAGPAAQGENTKSRLLQSDSLGRLTGVCEITSATGSGACGQSGQTGFWTTYVYNASGPSLSVTQNAQASGSQQTRSYVYDLLGRLTSESNPENGTVSYKYDSGTIGVCSVTNMGDLVFRTAASGVSTCYVYDALHRVLSVGHNPAQANGTPDKFFVYDSATVNGVVMTNPKRRLAEAYTCLSPCTKITDLGFSYTARGEISDTYQWSTNSGGYYHQNLTYYENGVPKLGSGLAGLPTFTYGLDGEGRVNSISASAGQNPLTATSYNPAGQPRAVTYGSLDNDAFTYDPNTFRLTKYQFNVNSQSYNGVLTWNANGSLNGLNITDPFNSADTQTCSYQHDDLSRIANVNCAPNQLANPGFESGNVDWSLGSGWSIVNNSANAQAGSWYLSGTSSTDTWAIATLGGSDYQPVTPGQVIQYGGWIERVAGTGNMWYSCEVVDASHNFLAWCPYGAGIGDGSGGTSWQFYQQEYTVPAGGAYVVYHTEIHGAGDPDTSVTTGYFDTASYGAPSAWSQVFGYDAFGNITKTVPSGGTGNSFQPTYSTSTNHITSLAGFTPTYDGDGDVTNDSNHTYGWDANGNASSVDGVAVTYDALDRAVEQNRSGANSQIVYTPLGQKFALMSGQTLQKAFVELPAGGQAVYTGSGLDHYRHSDWLGSSRFASNPNRTVLYDGAYAPFGEPYAQSGSTDLSYTGMNQDTSTGLYDFPAREYSTQGRWSRPDPGGLGAASLSDPQTLNRYAYVRNSALSLTDPLGLEPQQCRDGCPWKKKEPPAMCTGCSSGGFSWAPDSFLDQMDYLSLCGSDPLMDACLAQAKRPGPSGATQVWVPGGCVDSQAGHSCVSGEWLTQSGSITGTGISTLDNRANALAHAINATGVQSLGNPCTIAGFYVVSATGGALVVATAGAPATVEAATQDYPSLVNKFFIWLNRFQPRGTVGAALAIAKAAPATVQSGCSNLQ